MEKEKILKIYSEIESADITGNIIMLIISIIALLIQIIISGMIIGEYLIFGNPFIYIIPILMVIISYFLFFHKKIYIPQESELNKVATEVTSYFKKHNQE